MTKLHEAYYASVRADDDYSAELHRVYGSKAGDARYNSKLNTATPRLKTLHDIWQDAETTRHRMAMEGIRSQSGLTITGKKADGVK
jgi:hypothetical protein